ncbi:MAG: hypothetical protein NC548_39850 [Lachnospiraceae bacterium]|nr:hypothetical protein [Lachnospiraceae bacterium]
MHFGKIDFTTVEEGTKELKRMVNLRNSMGGAMYYNMCNEDVLRIADKLLDIGAVKQDLIDIMGTWEYM